MPPVFAGNLEIPSLDKPGFLSGNVGAARGRQTHSARKRNEKDPKNPAKKQTAKKVSASQIGTTR